MNILISYLSFYGRRTQRSYYTNDLCADEIITASQTNEAVLRLLEKRLEEKEEKIDKIITVLSFKVENEISGAVPDMTTYEFFRDLVREVVGTAEVLCSVREYENENASRETGAVIREICEHITAEDEIYIDTSGGTRTSANMLQLLAKILEYKGYKLAASYYSNINSEPAVIQTTKDFTELTMLADAVNEFVHTGRAYQLSECFKDEKHEDIVRLIEYMDEFTDRMQLCNISDLDDILTKMRSQIEKVRMIRSDETKIVILGNLLPVIENKFFEGSSDSIDYCRMIKWCLENKLVQQAVTIYIEKMPKYIFDNRILICDSKYYDDIKEKNANNPPKQNTDAVIFFEGFMDSVSYIGKADVIRLQTALREKFINSNQNYIFPQNLKKYMDVLYEIRRLTSNNFKVYVQSVSNNSESVVSDIEKRVVDFSLKKGCTSFQHLVNSLCKEELEVANIMGIKSEKLATLDKKIQTALNITMNNYYHEGVTINKKANINEIRSILFDYIYVKSVRNHINHASDEENLNEQQKKTFEDRSYNVREFTTKVISNTILASVERIENAASAVSKG